MTEQLNLMILVKAAPILTSEPREQVCVAAMTLGDEPKWIRLNPVPFRDLDDDKKFRKYQELKVQVTRPKSDRRPESWTPIVGTIQLGDTIGTQHGWSIRRQRVAQLGESTTCKLMKQNLAGSGPDTPSLAVVRAAERPELHITQRDKTQIHKCQQRAKSVAAQPSLFDDVDHPKSELDVIPWRFSYRYRCLAQGCKSHTQTIVDWEAVALYRNVRRQPDWKSLMKQKFEDELWEANRDTVLFVGNMQQHPQSFLVLGVFWPPKQPLQPSLLS